MKSAVLFLFIILPTMVSVAQNQDNSPQNATGKSEITSAAVPRPLTDSDQYCSGFVRREKVAATTFITGSPNSPHTSKLGSRDLVYISGGNVREGMLFSIVRELRDPNRSELFAGQHALMRKAGQPYAELGRVRVLDTRQKMAIGVIEFGCKAAVPGDLLIPFVERPPIVLPAPAALDRFTPTNGHLTGRILMAQDFDSLLGLGQKVYLSIGAEQQVKVGDVFRVFRAPQWELRDEVEALSYKTTMMEDAQKHPVQFRMGGLSLDPEFFEVGKGPKIKVADLPRRMVGEVVVLNVTPSSATAMITVALEDIHAGDGLEAR